MPKHSARVHSKRATLHLLVKYSNCRCNLDRRQASIQASTKGGFKCMPLHHPHNSRKRQLSFPSNSQPQLGQPRPTTRRFNDMPFKRSITPSQKAAPTRILPLCSRIMPYLPQKIKALKLCDKVSFKLAANSFASSSCWRSYTFLPVAIVFSFVFSRFNFKVICENFQHCAHFFMHSCKVYRLHIVPERKIFLT